MSGAKYFVPQETAHLIEKTRDSGRLSFNSFVLNGFLVDLARWTGNLRNRSVEFLRSRLSAIRIVIFKPVIGSRLSVIGYPARGMFGLQLTTDNRVPSMAIAISTEPIASHRRKPTCVSLAHDAIVPLSLDIL
jgi:hypothetical protein